MLLLICGKIATREQGALSALSCLALPSLRWARTPASSFSSSRTVTELNNVSIFVNGSSVSFEDVTGFSSTICSCTAGSAEPSGRACVPKVAELGEATAETTLQVPELSTSNLANMVTAGVANDKVSATKAGRTRASEYKRAQLADQSS